MKLYDIKNNKSNIVNPNNKDIFTKYMVEIAKYKPLSREEEVELFKKIEENKDQKAIDKLCKHNLLFVVAVAKNYAKLIKRSSLTLEDLVNEGNMGLCVAIHKFDYKTGNKFISFAVWWIKNHILKCMQENVKSIRVPDHVTRIVRKISKQEATLEQILGRAPSSIEIFEKILESNDNDVKKTDTMSKFDEILKINQYESSINSFVGLDEKVELSELLKSDDVVPDEELINKERHELAMKMLENLPPVIRSYFNDYFGLNDNTQLSLSEMGKKYGESGTTIKTRMDKYMRRVRYRNRQNREHFNYEPTF